LRPPLSCNAPMPRAVATPNSTAKIASMSIAFPIGPSTRSPIKGRNAALMRLPPSLRKLKYASAMATTAYTAHGCKPQWKKVYCRLSSAASVVPAFTIP
jgi:hypothetical protein